jgi:hypothetical protein
MEDHKLLVDGLPLLQLEAACGQEMQMDLSLEDHHLMI